MNEKIKKIIEDNISIIEDNDFDTLFNSVDNYAERVILAEALLSAGIDITNNNPYIKLKQQNVSKFINDLRLDRSVLMLKKSYLGADYWSDDPDNEYYVLGLPKHHVLSKKEEIPNIQKTYNVWGITRRTYVTGYMSGYTRSCLAFFML